MEKLLHLSYGADLAKMRREYHNLEMECRFMIYEENEWHFCGVQCDKRVGVYGEFCPEHQDIVDGLDQDAL